jgi:nucleotide-binding universal stress UspA family protein
MVAHVNLLGILIGIVFIGGMGMFFFSAFRAPASSPEPTARTRRSADKVAKILVPLFDDGPSDRAIDLACRWASLKKGELVLVRVIVVPDIHALDRPLPQSDLAANDALDRANAIVKQHGCRAQMYIVRHRKMSEGILEIARKENVDAILLRYGIETQMPAEWGRTSLDILKHAKCEVFVDRVPLAPGTMSA